MSHKFCKLQVKKDLSVCGNAFVKGDLKVCGSMKFGSAVLDEQVLNQLLSVGDNENTGSPVVVPAVSSAPSAPTTPFQVVVAAQSVGEEESPCDSFFDEDDCVESECNLQVCDKLCVGGDTKINGQLCLEGILAHSQECINLTNASLVGSPSLTKTVVVVESLGTSQKSGVLENGIKDGQILYLLGGNIAGGHYVLDTNTNTTVINAKGQLTNFLKLKRTGNSGFLIWIQKAIGGAGAWFVLNSKGGDLSDTDSIGSTD